MYLSKIYLFLTAVLAAAMLVIGLTMPQPAQRRVLGSEDLRLRQARSSVEMLLRENARDWMDSAASFARSSNFDRILDEASRSEDISSESNATARDALNGILRQLDEGQKPDFVLAVDGNGRTVAAVGSLVTQRGDDLGGYFLLRDTLRGYLRDDLWLEDNKLYRVAGAPVIDRVRGNYVGAIVVGNDVDRDLLDAIGKNVSASLAFFTNGAPVATTSAAAITKDIQSAFDRLAQEPDKKDSDGGLIMDEPLTIALGASSYRVVVRPLPGEAGLSRGFFAVFAERPAGLGFSETLKEVTKDDVGSLWITGAVVFVLLVTLGIALIWLEGDHPLKRLVEDALSVGNGDAEKFDEFKNKGKYGSVARSVNIALEKLARDLDKARAGGGDLNAVLGPPPSGGVGATLLPRSPHVPIGVPFAPPPPSDFSFAPPPPRPLPPKPAAPPPRLPPTPAQRRAATPPPAPGAPMFAPPPEPGGPELSADIFGDATVIAPPSSQLLHQTVGDNAEAAPARGPAAPGRDEDTYFRQVHRQFVDLQQSCGEDSGSVTYESFANKLRKNRDQLIARYNCKSVTFQVYVKDGKAALKATPVR